MNTSLRNFVTWIAAVTASSGFIDISMAAEPPCDFAEVELPFTVETSRGVMLGLPMDAEGPSYDSDDYFNSRPTWSGKNWRVHFVFGNGGLTEFMDDEACTLNDEVMHRRVKIGNYIRHGAMADIWRVDSPDKITSMQVSIEKNGLSGNQALVLISTAVTTWEKAE